MSDFGDREVGGGAPQVDAPSSYRNLRYLAVTATGRVLSTPGRLVGAWVAGKTAGQYVQLYDSTNTPQNLLGAVSDTQTRNVPFPPLAYGRVAFPLRRGLYASFSDPGTERVLMVAWDS